MPQNDPKLRYTSTSTIRSLWQEYRIYDDHLELDTHFGVMQIPYDVIERVEARPSDLKRLFTHGDLQLKDFRPALKIDWANFQEHVVLDKTEGRVRRILFTPDDVARFNTELQQAMAEFQSGSRAASAQGDEPESANDGT